MEPMTLGSPAGSPVGGGMTPGSGFLPAFLIGEQNTPQTPRNATISPGKGRSLAFGATSPTIPTSPEFGRPQPTRNLFSNQSPAPTSSLFGPQKSNTGVSGPPTQSLFDSLREERNAIPQSPTPTFEGLLQQSMKAQAANQSINESFNLNASQMSRLQSPGVSLDCLDTSRSIMSPSRQCDFWITVFGFPPSALSMILTHFSQCGSIVDKVLPPQSGNWVHLKFTSRLECDRAINFNEKILAGTLMIGVTRCKDPTLVSRENQVIYENGHSRVRPLTQIALKNAQSPIDVAPSPTTPKRSTGIVNKAMDFFFGW
ncbi:nucleoporin Nup35 isoform X1 [Lutzomyia longipalpis]|uniref:Nucleoporin NUP53 n=2 Tax=Lutzomyia longipalpis TaxID=7200 RepID=A0A7G3AR50_LUTLO|nr:nucleoporin Nup35 isoform X1 [Lutzomyia longipalpis]